MKSITFYFYETMSHVLTLKMAASIDGAGCSKPKERHSKVPEQLDLTSPLFDPLEALRSKEVILPCPDVKPFDNLSRYESSTKSKAKSSSKSEFEKEIEIRNTSSINVKQTRPSGSNKKLEADISSQLARIRFEPKASGSDICLSRDTKVEKVELSAKERRSQKERELLALRRKRRQRNVFTRMEGKLDSVI